MPVKKFTQQEIENIQKRHEQLVDTMNKYLIDDRKIAVSSMAEKLADEKTAERYRLAQELNDKRLDGIRIAGELQDLYNQGEYPFPSEFLPDTTPENKAYNKALYDEFAANPDKVYYRNFKKMLGTSAKELYACGDDPDKLMEYYKNHFNECEAASKFVNYVEKNPNASADLKKQLPTIKQLVALVEYPKTLTEKFGNIDYLACPALAKNQATFLDRSPMAHMDNTPAVVNEYVTDVATGVPQNPSPKQYMDKFAKSSDPIHKQDAFITKYFATREIDDEEVAVGMDEWTNPETKASVRIRLAKTDRATFTIDAINRGVQAAYCREWQNVFNEKRGHEGAFDINEIEHAYRGGFWERRLGTTSNEYKRLIQAFKDFHNPDSPHYLDYRNLRGAANGYRAHKAEQGYGTEKELTGTSLSRSNFANAILETIDEHERIFEKVDREFTQTIEQPKLEQEQPLIQENEVEELIADNENVQQVENEAEHQVEQQAEEEANSENESELDEEEYAPLEEPPTFLDPKELEDDGLLVDESIEQPENDVLIVDDVDDPSVNN